MAQLRPLRLISQRANNNLEISPDSDIVVEVVVDTPVLHLDALYTYGLSQKQSEVCEVGNLLKIPFGKTITTGYVVEIRKRNSKDVGIRGVLSILSSSPLLQPEIWKLIKSVAVRYCTNPSDLIRFAIPPRVANCEKKAITVKPRQVLSAETNLLPKIYGADIAKLDAIKNGAIVLPIAVDSFALIIEFILRKLQDGPTLVILPDLKDTTRLEEQLQNYPGINFTRFDSSMNKSDRYTAFLEILQGAKNLVIGNRSAIFAPLPNLQNIIVYNESDPSHFERRSPYTNTRDLALLRASSEKVALWFLDSSPSLELLRLVESKWLPFYVPSGEFLRKRNIGITSGDAEYSRKNVFTVIRKGLEKGPVLIVVAERGYFNSAICEQCSNQALCVCGGKLVLSKASNPPQCSICNVSYPEWKCTWCNSTKFYKFIKGDERHAEEFGKAFPKVRVITSNGSLSQERIGTESCIIIATPGCEPITPEGYGAVVLLDGRAMFNRPYLRSEEEARFRWLNALTLLRNDGEIFLSLADSHPEVQSLLQQTPLKSSRIELQNRKDLQLPPYTRFIEVQCDSKEISVIADQFRSETSLKCEVLGPTQIDKENSKIILKATIEDGARLSEAVYDLLRYRSAKGRKALKVRVDPFTI